MKMIKFFVVLFILFMTITPLLMIGFINGMAMLVGDPTIGVSFELYYKVLVGMVEHIFT